MGVNPFWQEDFFLTLQNICHQAEIVDTIPCNIVETEKIAINLISLDHQLNSAQLIALQESYQTNGKQLVHLWEDIWLTRREQVLSRLKSFLDLNNRVHGRKTKIAGVNVADTKRFLTENHLQGYVNAKFHYGLYNDSQLIALASFSGARPMKSKGENYRSAELVRFASKAGITVVGGLGKLIKHFLGDNPVHDLMTYADRDWSLGKGYDKMGFEHSETISPILFYFDPKTERRYLPNKLPTTATVAFESQNSLTLDEFLKANGYFQVFNTGNLKYFYYT
ncbi:MAG: hypothetical protein EOO47_09455 [Flavobacterium sp.]|nr:MAG: hypothetical protein EOO47_09455 [Flavobacterium sp.]